MGGIRPSFIVRAIALVEQHGEKFTELTTTAHGAAVDRRRLKLRNWIAGYVTRTASDEPTEVGPAHHTSTGRGILSTSTLKRLMC